METSTISFCSSSPPSTAAASAAHADLDAVSLGRLSANLDRLLDPAFLDCTDAEIALSGDGVVGVHRCILSARSRFFLDHFSSPAAAPGEKPRLELAKLVPRGRHVGRDALVAVLGYLYTGRLKPPPQGAAVCVDDGCEHAACRPAIDFVVESTYAAATFQIPELVSVFQRHLFYFVDIAQFEDIIPVILIASTCQLLDLLNHCIQRVATSNLDNSYLEKELLSDTATYDKIKQIRRQSLPNELGNVLLESEDKKKVRNIRKALDSDDVHLVRLLLTESLVTLDDAFAIHYAAAYCEPKVLAELLKLESANMNLKNDSGYTPLHIACMRREPDIIVSLLHKGAFVSEMTPDGRNALTICKRLTTEKEYNRKVENSQERSKAYLCIDILEREMKRNPFNFENQLSVEESIATPLLIDNFHMRLQDLENRVAFAKLFFPSEAKLAMRIAQADSTKEFQGLNTTNTSSKLKEVDLNETPETQKKRLRERLDALTKTVGLGRRYFPNCSEVLDKLLEDDLLFLETGTPEDQQIKRMRFAELKEDFQKAATKDKAARGGISSSLSSSSSPRFDAKGKQASKKGKLSR